MLVRAAEDTEVRQAQAVAVAAAADDEHGGMGPWMHGREGGWPQGMMMHHMMMHRDPQERCTERLAMRAAMRAYAEAKLNLTAEQRPLWDKVLSAAQAEEQPGAEATLLDRMDRIQQFLSTRLDALQSAKPAVQALYQALTPEQRAILDHPYRR
jgi:Spy/CpxP family protein refolding chaperone